MNLVLPAQYNFIPRYFRLAVANVLSSIMVPLANIASVMFLGHLEEIRHFAGVNIAGNLLNFLYLALFFLRMGTTGVTAQAVGRDDREGMLLVGLRNGLIALVLGVALILLQYPLGELGFALINVPPEIKSSGLAYFNTQIWGAPAILLNFVLIGWFLGREKNGLVVFLSVLGNGGKIALDYLLIVHLGWASVGAGVSYATSQYLALLVGVIFFFKEFQWIEIRSLFGKIWDISAIKSNLTLNTNILLSNLILLVVSLTFSYQGVQMGTLIYSQNALLWLIFNLNTYFVEGLGFGTETLVGNFKGKGDSQQLPPIAFVSLSTALVVGVCFGGVCVLFPDSIFRLFTNHTEVTSNINISLPWLQAILVFCSIGYTLEGYFLGLAQGQILRNVSIVPFVVAFIPTNIAFFKFPSNNLLWFSVCLFYGIRMVMYIINLFSTFGSNVVDSGDSIPALEENRALGGDL
ncbi:guanitoxin biosynthesis MATE family efflux transporter GntT [Microcoleus anatoxicus]|uniref:Probable multidrug resistance protein NorM n=1 Tax=Microcoleus anatoxicus PTRS2 TaxID=2705321 RepID=A0ABU8YMF9_9CYAN